MKHPALKEIWQLLEDHGDSIPREELEWIFVKHGIACRRFATVHDCEESQWPIKPLDIILSLTRDGQRELFG